VCVRACVEKKREGRREREEREKIGMNEREHLEFLRRTHQFP